MKTICLVILCLWCGTVVHAQVPRLDASGKPFTKEVAALIGKKFTALPVDPKLGDKSPAMPRINGWIFVRNSIGKTEKEIIRDRFKEYETRKQFERTLLHISKIADNTNHQEHVKCKSDYWGTFASANRVILTLMTYCEDETITIDDVLAVPIGYGIELTRRDTPTFKATAEGIVFLPAKFFNWKYCPYYQKAMIEIATNGGISYKINSTTRRFERTNDTRVYADNPNEICGD